MEHINGQKNSFSITLPNECYHRRYPSQNSEAGDKLGSQMH